MQAVVIKQANGLWTLETSAGVRWSAGALGTLLDKALPRLIQERDLEGAHVALEKLFATIPDSGSGQIGQGVAGA